MNIQVEEKFDRKGVSKGFTITYKDADGTIVKFNNVHGMHNVIKLLKNLKEVKNV